MPNDITDPLVEIRDERTTYELRIMAAGGVDPADLAASLASVCAAADQEGYHVIVDARGLPPVAAFALRTAGFRPSNMLVRPPSGV